MKKIFILVSFVIAMVGCAAKDHNNSPSSEDARKPPNTQEIINAIELNCKISNPHVLCSCVTDKLNSRVKANEGKSLQIIFSNQYIEESTTQCMLSTGVAKTMMNNASVGCYVNGPENLINIDPENRNIPYLQKMHPDKVKKCSCFQAEINKAGEEKFLLESMAEYERFKQKAKCKKENPESKCDNGEKESFINNISKKCGL